MNWNGWLKGLGAALLGAATTGAGAVVQNRLQKGKDAPPITGGNVLASAGIGALVTLVAYLAQSPMPTEQPVEPPK